VWAQGTAPAVVTADTMRPAIPYGVNGADDARRISERVVGGPLDEQARRPVGPAPHDRQPRQVHARREIALGERSLTTSPPA
jgi:hypothetical protein